MDREALRKSLEDHRSADSTEDAHCARMLGLLESEGDPFARSHYMPGHFTASAFVLSPEGSELLLIYHAKLNLWLQPGGHVDAEDSDIFAAACREVREETCVTNYILDTAYSEFLDLDIHKIPPNPGKGEPEHEHFDIRILLRSRDREISAGSDALDARWVALTEIEAVATDDSVMRAVRKLRARAR